MVDRTSHSDSMARTWQDPVVRDRRITSMKEAKWNKYELNGRRIQIGDVLVLVSGRRGSSYTAIYNGTVVRCNGISLPGITMNVLATLVAAEAKRLGGCCGYCGKSLTEK